MNSQNTEIKQHYKMYKSGKQWIYAAITTIAVIAGTAAFAGNTVNADTTTQPAVTASVSEPSNKPSDVVASNPTTVTDSISNKTENSGSDAESEKTVTKLLNSNNDNSETINETHGSTPYTKNNDLKDNNKTSSTNTNNETNSLENKQTAVTTNFITEKTTDNSETDVVNDSHVQKRDGKTYFIGDDGEPKKNFTAIINCLVA